MNDRVMQFRLGMFVIVAGLVLTMLIIWFGESPSILRDQVYVRVRYTEAPGVIEGVAVRKSGIRIGQVFNIDFDERPGAPDGVLVTLAIERRYRLREGCVPRLTRSLIGDVSIDMQPGTGPGVMSMGRSPRDAPVIEGEVAADPSKALAAATKAFESAGDTLSVVKDAAAGLSRLSKSGDKLDNFLSTWDETGKDVSTAGKNLSTAAKSFNRFIEANENDFKPALENFRQVAQKLNNTIDPKTQDSLKTGVEKFASAAARLDSELAQIEPAIRELGGPVDQKPVTDLGQAVRRINVLAADLELLTSKLRNGRGGLNTEGSLQKLVTQAELHDNLNAMAVSANQALQQLKLVLNSLRGFADKVSRDPGAISRGALDRQ
jgi:phospholipid/cholesterol/gamma-HCH transport system substrate-binding protein